MRTFDEIYEIAALRKSGNIALEALLKKPATAENLAQTTDYRWLAEMARAVF
jgi:hypothetical protein